MHRVRQTPPLAWNVTAPPGGRPRLGTRARGAVGVGGREECGPSTGSLFPTSCNKVTRTLVALHPCGGNPSLWGKEVGTSNAL